MKKVKAQLNHDFDTSFERISDCCHDYDNEYGTEFYAKLCDLDLIWEEDDMAIHIERAENDINRLRCFIGDTHYANIYKLDGYGNLQNISLSDLEDACDYVIETAKTEIKDLKNEME